MVRRQNIQSKAHRLVKKVSHRSAKTSEETSSPTVKHSLSEHLDDETKLAKRHLTKEMWQLVSIAVKRMADELVTISTNQQTTSRTSSQDLQTSTTHHNQPSTSTETNKVSAQPSSTVQQPMTTNLGAGDVSFTKENKQTLKRRTLPIQLLEPSSSSKKKGASNNATRRRTKSKISNKSSKKSGKPKTIKRLRKN